MDYDKWAEFGNRGWSFKDVLPYFKKTENMLDPKAAENRRFHSTGGPVAVEYPAFRTKCADVYLKAAESIGHNIIEDFNAEEMEGFGKFHFTARNGRRENTGKAFLKEAKRRSCKRHDFVRNS